MKSIILAFLLLSFSMAVIAAENPNEFNFTVSNTSFKPYYRGPYKVKYLMPNMVSCGKKACPKILQSGQTIKYKINVKKNPLGTNFAAIWFVSTNPVMAANNSQLLEDLCQAPGMNYAILGYMLTIGGEGSAVLFGEFSGYPKSAYATAAYCCDSLPVCEHNVQLDLRVREKGLGL